jgi:hypothetical protein
MSNDKCQMPNQGPMIESRRTCCVEQGIREPGMASGRSAQRRPDRQFELEFLICHLTLGICHSLRKPPNGFGLS